MTLLLGRANINRYCNWFLHYLELLNYLWAYLCVCCCIEAEVNKYTGEQALRYVTVTL